MTDRRRINAPVGGTAAALFSPELIANNRDLSRRPVRHRKGHDIRKIFLKTQLTPSASGSAYLELEPAAPTGSSILLSQTPALKLTCTVHGPRPLPRSASYSPHMQLTTHIKFAPFASRHRRGYLRDAGERDLAAHLETALRGVIISDRWPKSGIEVNITVLEGEESQWWRDEASPHMGHGPKSSLHGMMSILSGCITVASAAIIDAGIDCVDVASGGVAALVQKHTGDGDQAEVSADPRDNYSVVLDPAPCEHEQIAAVCVVGYLTSLEEVTEVWIHGGAGAVMRDQAALDLLIDAAVQAASASALVVREAIGPA